MTEPPVQPSVTLTPLRAVVVAVVFGGLTGWVFASVTTSFGLDTTVPWTTPIALGLVVVLVGALAYGTWQRLHVRHERIEPQRAVAFLVLGKASALGGAFVVGAYAGFALRFLSRLDAEGPRERVVASAVCVLAGAALCGAGLLLERACQVPRIDDDEQETSDTAT